MTQNPFAGNDPAQPNQTVPPNQTDQPSWSNLPGYPVQTGFPGDPNAPLPNQSELAGANVDRPRSIDLAVLSSLVAVGCWFVANVAGQALHSGGALTLTYTASQTQYHGGQAVSYTQTDVGPAPFGFALAAYVFIGGFWVLLIGFMRLGANWARVLLTVFGGLGLLGDPVDISRSLGTSPQNAGGIIQGVLSLAVFALVVMALVMMYRRQANQYFQWRRYQRQAQRLR